MPVQENFLYTSTTGKPLPTIDEWICTLPGEQQLEYMMAAKRQQMLRKKLIEQNKLTVVKTHTQDQPYFDSYVWEDDHAKQKPVGVRKQWDRVWLQYWTRYLKETGAEFKIVEKPID